MKKEPPLKDYIPASSSGHFLKTCALLRGINLRCSIHKVTNTNGKYAPRESIIQKGTLPYKKELYIYAPDEGDHIYKRLHTQKGIIRALQRERIERLVMYCYKRLLLFFIVEYKKNVYTIGKDSLKNPLYGWHTGGTICEMDFVHIRLTRLRLLVHFRAKLLTNNPFLRVYSIVELYFFYSSVKETQRFRQFSPICPLYYSCVDPAIFFCHRLTKSLSTQSPTVRNFFFGKNLPFSSEIVIRFLKHASKSYDFFLVVHK